MKQKVLFLLLFLVPFYVKADTISINCPSEVDVNTEFSCDVMGNTTNGVNDVKFSISLSSNLKFVTFVNGSGFNGEGEQELVALYSSKTYKGSFKIGTLKLKSLDSGNGSVSLDEVFFYLNGKNSINSISKNITIVKPVSNSNNNSNNSNSNNNSNKNNNSTDSNSNNNSNKNNNSTDSNSNKNSNSNSNNNNNNIDDGNEIQEEQVVDENEYFLSDLKIEGYDISFRKDVYNYDVTIKNEDSLVIKPVVSNNNITYNIVGNSDLKDGSIIIVEAKYKDESIQSYYLNIKKIENKNKFNYIPIFIVIIIGLILLNGVRIFLNRKNNK